MPYNKDATRQILQLIGLAPGSQRLANIWLDRWTDGHLPDIDQLLPHLPEPWRRFVLVQRVFGDGRLPISYMGEALVRLAQADFTGSDYAAIASPTARPERRRRAKAVAAGAILRATHKLRLKNGNEHFFELISLPMHPYADGSGSIVCFLDISSIAEGEMMPEREEFSRVPEAPEILELPVAELNMAQISGKSLQRDERVKIISRAAIRFLLNMFDDALTTIPGQKLDPIDYLLAITVGSANVSHIENDPKLSLQYAGLIEPDSMRRGISRAAISRSTSLPLETVRRRINRLVKIGILVERDDGVVLSASNAYKIDARTDRMHAQAQMVERMFRDMKARGVTLS